MRSTGILLVVILLARVAFAQAAAEETVLFDFENGAELGAWQVLAPVEGKEPAPTMELAAEGATHGAKSLKITFAGGHLPAVTATKLPAADWLAAGTLRADVTVSRPCVLGIRVLQKKGSRFAQWSPQILRWQKVQKLPQGKTTIEGDLHPNDQSPVRADLGPVVAIDVFVCDAPKDLVVYVDNVRLGPAEKPAGPGVKTDLGIHPLPAPPELPNVGETYTDPTFGTTILRLTDESEGDCHNAYSYWPSFNKDCTLLHYNSVKNGAQLVHFDPKNFKALRRENLFPRAVQFRWEDSIWSGTEPNVLYGHEGSKIFAYDVEKKANTLVRDFAKEFPDAVLVQMSKNVDDNVFGFTLNAAKGNKTLGYIAWQRNPDKVLYHGVTDDIDEVQVDKAGRYLVVKTGQQGAEVLNVRVIDLQTGKFDDLKDGAPDYSPGHSDNGRGIVVGADNFRNCTTVRKLAAPHDHYAVIDTSPGHLSMLADDEEWCLFSNYYWKGKPTDRPWGTFADEILLVATDGSQRVRRLAHHFSKVDGSYWASPRADISRDGRFVVYTSNFGQKTLQVFVLRVPEEYVPATGR